MVRWAAGIAAGVFLAAAVCEGWAANGEAMKPDTLPLVFEAGKVGELYTPGTVTNALYEWRIPDRGWRAFGSADWAARGETEAHGALPIGQFVIPMGIRIAGPGGQVGLDCNADGAIDEREWVFLGAEGTASFRVQLPSQGAPTRDYALTIKKAKMHVALGVPKGLQGLWRVDFSMKGQIGGKVVRIIDDNCDGVFTQSGADAIVIGDSRVALPLGRACQIGRDHYRIEVPADGTSITYRLLEVLELGAVETPIPQQMLLSLILVDQDGQAYDVAAGGRYGIPPGRYELLYGLLQVGGRFSPITPGPGTPEYPITGRVRNRLRIGPPFHLGFGTSLDTRREALQVNNPVVIGAGGELHGFEFSRRGGIPYPQVLVTAGSRVLYSSRLGQWYDDTHTSLRSIPFKEIPVREGDVVVIAQAPGIGAVKGSKTLAEIVSGTPPELPEPPPAVVTSPWREAPSPRAKADEAAQEETSDEAKDEPAQAEDDAEKDARGLLGLAKTYLAAGSRDKAASLLREVVEKYPRTKAAEEARSLLDGADE